MYRPAGFAVDDVATLHEVIRGRIFATVAYVDNGAVQLAYAPVVLDETMGPLGGIRFHLALRNPATSIEDGTRVRVSFLAADAYVSSDWYETIVTVPTWNYIAVEGEGAVHKLDPYSLQALVIALSAQEEAKLAPKAPWTVDKLPEGRFAALLNAIVGFALPFERLEGKFKLSQDKNPDDRRGVIAGLEARDDPASLAVVRAMRKTSGS